MSCVHTCCVRAFRSRVSRLIIYSENELGAYFRVQSAPFVFHDGVNQNRHAPLGLSRFYQVM